MAANKIQVGYIEAQDGAQFEVDAGTAAAPGLCFDNSAATGLYSPGTGQIAWSTSGKQTALRILADGKVGVDCSPTVALEVNGTIKASAIDAPIEGTLDDWIVHAGDSNTKIGFPANDEFEVHTGGGPTLRIDSTGKLGISHSSPSTIIHAVGNSTVGTSVTMTLQTHDTANATAGIHLLARDNSNNNEICKIQAASGGQETVDLQFHTNNTEKFRIDSAGRCIVGGGTHAGGSALVVKGGNQNTYSTIGMFSNHTNPAADTLLSQIRFGSNTSAVGADIRVYADADWGTNDYPTRMSFYTTDDGTNTRDERLSIDSGGKILAGTSSSRAVAGGYAKIQVEAASSEGISLTRTTNDAGASYFSFGKIRTGGSNSGRCVAGDNIGAISWNPSDGTDLNHAAAEIQCLVASGIGGNDVPGDLVFKTNSGTTTTAERLRIASDGEILVPAAGANRLSMRHTSGGNFVIKNPTAAYLSFGTNNNDEEFVIANGGNVGIGCTNPGADPAVGNDATVLEIRQTTTGTLQSGNDRRGAVLRLKHEAQWENGYQSSANDDLGRIEFVTGDNSTGEGKRAIIRCRNLQYYNHHALTFEVATANSTTVPEIMRLESGRVMIAGATDNTNAHANADDLIIGNTGSDQRTGITIVSDTDKDGAIHFSDGSGAGQLKGQIVYGHTFGSLSDVLALYTDGSTSMLIQDDGDVVLGEIGGTRYTELSSSAQLRVVGDADNGRPGAISLFGFGNTSNEAHARINFQQQTSGSNGQTTARIEAINRSSGEDASDLVFYTEKTGQDLKECARMTTRGELLINRTDTVSTNLSFDSVHLGIGSNYGPNLSYRTIGFGYRQNSTSEYPASIGCQITDWAANTKAELVFATRNSTGQADVATERMRIKADGTTEFASKKWRIDASGFGQLEEYPYNTSTSSFSTSTSNGYHLARVRNGQVPQGTSGNTYTLMNTNTIGEAGAYILVLRSFEQAQTGGNLWSVRMVTSPFYLHSGSGNDGETMTIPYTYSGHANNATTQAGNGHGPIILRTHFYQGSAHTHGKITISFEGFNYTGTNCDYYLYKLIDV